MSAAVSGSAQRLLVLGGLVCGREQSTLAVAEVHLPSLDGDDNIPGARLWV